MEQLQHRFERRKERRQHRRCPVGSRASLVDAQDVLGRFQVENLSVGGALLSGISAPAPGTDSVALLHLPWHRPLAVRAHVVHHREPTTSRRQFGIQFSHPTGESSRVIERALRSRGAAMGRRPYLTALIYTDRARLQLDLERDLARLGVRSFTTGSRDELLRWAGPLGTSLVLVDVWTDPPGAIELLGALQRHTPQITRITVLDDSSTIFGTLAAAVACSQATLLSPWDRAGLAEVIGGPASLADH